MTLGPLFGFLIGSMLGTDGETLGMSPIFLFLFLGFLVAGVGLFMALIGARRILRSQRDGAVSRRSEHTQPRPAETGPDAG